MVVRIALAALPCLAFSASASSGLVYQGRAMFEEVRPAIVPKQFTGTWVKDRKMCKARAARGKLVVMAQTIVVTSGKMPVRRVLLNPRQRPDHDRAIIETGNAGSARTLIFQMAGNSKLTVTVRGQSGSTTYLRCI